MVKNMKKAFLCITLLTNVLFATTAYSGDVVDRISDIDQQIAQLQSEKENLLQNSTESDTLNYSSQIDFYDIFPGGMGQLFGAIVEVNNTGDDYLYLGKDSIFDIEDKDGHLIATEQYLDNVPDIIGPGETGYIYTSLSNIDVGATTSNTKLVPTLDIEATDKVPIDYQISDVSLTKDSYGYSSLIGRVTNVTDEDDASVDVIAVFFDDDNEAISVADTYVMDFKAGETRSFDIQCALG